MKQVFVLGWFGAAVLAALAAVGCGEESGGSGGSGASAGSGGSGASGGGGAETCSLRSQACEQCRTDKCAGKCTSDACLAKYETLKDCACEAEAAGDSAAGCVSDFGGGDAEAYSLSMCLNNYCGDPCNY